MKRNWKLLSALVVTGLWLWFIYARSAKPADVSDGDLLIRLFPFINMKIVRKLAHFTEYFILGGLLYLDWRLLNRGRVILPLGAGLIFAAADEYLQTFIPGRSGEILDTLLDFCGVAAAVTAALLLRRRRGGRNC